MSVIENIKDKIAGKSNRKLTAIGMLGAAAMLSGCAVQEAVVEVGANANHLLDNVVSQPVETIIGFALTGLAYGLVQVAYWGVSEYGSRVAQSARGSVPFSQTDDFKGMLQIAQVKGLDVESPEQKEALGGFIEALTGGGNQNKEPIWQGFKKRLSIIPIKEGGEWGKAAIMLYASLLLGNSLSSLPEGPERWGVQLVTALAMVATFQDAVRAVKPTFLR